MSSLYGGRVEGAEMIDPDDDALRLLDPAPKAWNRRSRCRRLHRVAQLAAI
jgi:hypothetical protein